MSQISSPTRHNLWRLAIAAVALPAAFVAIDRLLLDCLAGLWRTDWTMVLTMAVFVVQIGMMGVVCGRWIDWPFLRWLLYGWCWLLIDFQTLIAWALAGQYWWADAFKAAALFAAQLGLLTIWAVLGTTRWTIRLPLALVPAVVLTLVLIRFQYWGENAAVLFAVQILALTAVCIGLRRQGYRLAFVCAERQGFITAPHANLLQTNQFELRDVLVWTTAIAVILGIVRAVGMPFDQWIETGYRSLVPLVFGGAAVAIVLVIVLWGALGAGSVRMRWSLMIVAVPSVGVASGLAEWLAWFWQNRIWTARWARGRSWWAWLSSFYYQERHLLAWFCLAGAMLFATLLFLRALGYRLERVSLADTNRARDTG